MKLFHNQTNACVHALVLQAKDASFSKETLGESSN